MTCSFLFRGPFSDSVNLDPNYGTFKPMPQIETLFRVTLQLHKDKKDSDSRKGEILRGGGAQRAGGSFCKSTSCHKGDNLERVEVSQLTENQHQPAATKREKKNKWLKGDYDPLDNRVRDQWTSELACNRCATPKANRTGGKF